MGTTAKGYTGRASLLDLAAKRVSWGIDAPQETRHWPPFDHSCLQEYINAASAQNPRLVRAKLGSM